MQRPYFAGLYDFALPEPEDATRPGSRLFLALPTAVGWRGGYVPGGR